MKKRTAAETCKKLEVLMSNQKQSTWTETPGLNENVLIKYGKQEANEMRKIIKADAVLIRQTTVFRNGLANYEIINAYGETISELTDSANLEKIKEYEELPIDKSKAKQYNPTATAKAAYKAKSVQRLELNFFPNDKDICEHLEKQPNKNGYIKELIRKDMETE